MPADYFFELSYRQVESGHDVDVITWSRSGKSNIVKTSEGFTIYRTDGVNFSVGSMVQDFPYLPALPFLLKRLKPDIIHGESHLFLPTLQAVKTAKKLKIPSVVTIHRVFADRGFLINSIEKLYLRTIGREIFKKTNLIICLTLADAKEIMHIGADPKKIRIVPNGIDTSFFKPNASKDYKQIVWVGRFVNEKGVEYLIKSAKLVLDQFKDAHFTLIGYGPLKSKMELLAKDLGIPKESITFTNALKRNQIADILSQSGLFVFPSLKEGMPLALLEAMATGNAVVAFNIPGVNSVVKDNKNGLIVEPKDITGFSKAILKLLTDEPLRVKLSNAAQKCVENDYSIECTLKRLDAVYNEAKRESARSGQ
jgi:glycosyltransferase involved in cell wall biosynthesis